LDKLKAFFSKSPPTVQHEIEKLGKSLFRNYPTLIRLRFDIGSDLKQIKDYVDDQRMNWSRFCEEINWVRQTADNYITDYLSAIEVRDELRAEALQRGYDIAEKAYKALRTALKERGEGEDLTNPLRTSTVFELCLSDYKRDKAEQQKRRADAAVVAEEQAAARLVESLADHSTPEKSEETNNAGATALVQSVDTPRKGLKWFVNRELGRGKSPEQIMQAVIWEISRQSKPDYSLDVSEDDDSLEEIE